MSKKSKRKSQKGKSKIQNSRETIDTELVSNPKVVTNAGATISNQVKETPGLGGDQSMAIRNGLTDAIFGFGNVGVGSQLSQVDTLFKNNRWYLVSNLRQLLSESYVEFGIFQTVVDVPVDDAFRGGVKIKTKQLDDDQLTELENKMEREKDLETIAQAQKWNRLFGGAGVLVITNQDPKKELDIGAIKQDSRVEFRALDMWELYYSHQNTEDYSAAIDGDTGESLGEQEFYDYYGKQVHKSRVLKFVGLKAPSFIRPRLRGWGFSIIESMIRSINQYLKATDLTFEVLDEFKVDVFKIHNLAATLLTQGGTEKVQQRIELANRQKNFQHAIAMDGLDDYVQKQLTFSGLSEVMDGIKKQLASDLRFPLTKLFGISSSGFSSGEDDIENYNSMVESTVRKKTKFEIIKVAEIRCQQLFGFVPDDIEIEFTPLRVLSSEQEENVKNAKFTRVLQARQAGELSSSDFKEACNRDDLLPLKLNIDDTIYPTPMSPSDTSDLSGAEKPAPSTMTTKPPPAAKNSMEERHIAVMAIVADNYVLTGKRRDNGRWVFPGGSIEGRESPIEAACRETFEESGISGIKDKAKPLGVETIKGRHGGNLMVHPFMAKVNKRSMPRTVIDPDNEVEVWRWVPIAKETMELMPENRHAQNDIILKHLFKE